MEIEKVLQQILNKITGLESGQQKIQLAIDKITVKVSEIDTTIQYIFNDIYRLEKRIENK